MVSVVADAGILTGPGEGVRFGECRGLGKIVFADLDGAVGGNAGLEDDASVVREEGAGEEVGFDGRREVGGLKDSAERVGHELAVDRDVAHESELAGVVETERGADTGPWAVARVDDGVLCFGDQAIGERPDRPAGIGRIRGEDAVNHDRITEGLDAADGRRRGGHAIVGTGDARADNKRDVVGVVDLDSEAVDEAAAGAGFAQQAAGSAGEKRMRLPEAIAEKATVPRLLMDTPGRMLTMPRSPLLATGRKSAD